MYSLVFNNYIYTPFISYIFIIAIANLIMFFSMFFFLIQNFVTVVTKMSLTIDTFNQIKLIASVPIDWFAANGTHNEIKMLNLILILDKEIVFYFNFCFFVQVIIKFSCNDVSTLTGFSKVRVPLNLNSTAPAEISSTSSASHFVTSINFRSCKRAIRTLFSALLNVFQVKNLFHHLCLSSFIYKLRVIYFCLHNSFTFLTIVVFFFAPNAKRKATIRTISSILFWF